MQKRQLLAAVGLAVALALNSQVTRAQSKVRILENRGSAVFAERITFELVAEHEEGIEEVILYYRRQKERVTTRVEPDYVPGPRVEARYEEKLERGEIPPGTVIEYHWRLGLADRTEFDTEKRTFAYEDERFDWQALSANNLTILHYGGKSEAELAAELAERGEETLARLKDEVGVALEAPTRVYVYRNATDMEGALSPRSQGFDERVLTLGVAVAEDTLLLLGSHPDVRQTLAHELSHIVVGLATKNPYAPLPRWLDEGLAMYAEGELRADNARALQDAIRRDALISVRSLSGYTGDPTQIDLYYGEVYSLVEYLLRTHGRDKMRELLEVFAEGAYQEDALRQVYGLTLDELDAHWRESLGLEPRATAGPVGEDTPPASRSQPSGQPCASSGLVGVLGLAAAVHVGRARSR